MMMEEDKEAFRLDAMNWLMQRPLERHDMLEAMRRGLTQAEVFTGGGMLQRLHGGMCFVAGDTPADVDALYDMTKDAPLIVTHEVDTANRWAAGMPEAQAMRCYQMVFRGTTLPSYTVPGYELRQVTPSEATLVSSLYSLHHDDADMDETIRSGMIGAYYDGSLTGFVGLHSEGSMGMLEVLPAHRRKGLGRMLEAAMIRMELARGHQPYGQVKAENEASLALQASLGMASTTTPCITWLIRE